MMPLNKAIELAEQFESEEVIGSTAQALRALHRAYNELLEEYQTYESYVETTKGLMGDT